jgi:UDP-N-acetylmuramyl tripeptide synthase
VLRDKRVTFGLLETARGGLMRRGLALEESDLSVILNISEDHLCDWGTPDLESLTDAKFIVARVAKTVLLNADDEQLVRGAERNLQSSTAVLWFSLDAKSEIIANHTESGGRAVVLDGDRIILRGPWSTDSAQGSQGSIDVCSVKDVPMTLGGAARYNVSNALAAVAIAAFAGIDAGTIATGLTTFQSDATNNPGRLNEFHFDGIRVLVDFAHNPAGLEAFFALGNALDAERRLFMIGQAGDRDEASTREMARIAWSAAPDMLILKELTLNLRGRELGETPAMMEAELRDLGAPKDRWCHAPNEMEAVKMALAWAEPGDLLLLLIHDTRTEALELLSRRAAATSSTA